MGGVQEVGVVTSPEHPAHENRGGDSVCGKTGEELDLKVRERERAKEREKGSELERASTGEDTNSMREREEAQQWRQPERRGQ